MNGSRDLIVSSLAHRHLIIATPAPRTAKETEPVKHSDTKIGTLTADKFREKLKKGKIRSPENSLKPNLQVLYGLSKLCLLFPEETQVTRSWIQSRDGVACQLRSCQRRSRSKA